MNDSDLEMRVAEAIRSAYAADTGGGRDDLCGEVADWLGEARAAVQVVRRHRGPEPLHGYTWLLNGVGLSPTVTDHAAHLDDQVTDSDCYFCRIGYGGVE